MEVTMQEIGLNNKVHLCSSCSHEYPVCDSGDIVYGNGKGNDNIAACSEYEALKFRESIKETICKIS